MNLGINIKQSIIDPYKCITLKSPRSDGYAIRRR